MALEHRPMRILPPCWHHIAIRLMLDCKLMAGRISQLIWLPGCTPCLVTVVVDVGLEDTEHVSDTLQVVEASTHCVRRHARGVSQRYLQRGWITMATRGLTLKPGMYMCTCVRVCTRICMRMSMCMRAGIC
mmetsp:Transcript_23376/g.46687  ORF Transcript_23376/g.46687 Transcript_23376/m.46687 type:complete len:131 (+) Transcript_23376:1097-1489(+)